jgi:hypothetical protein
MEYNQITIILIYANPIILQGVNEMVKKKKKKLGEIPQKRNEVGEGDVRQGADVTHTVGGKPIHEHNTTLVK